MLARLNGELIEDEQHDNTISIEQLKKRMADLIHSDYAAYVFKNEGEVIGYALVNHRSDPVYLRQFYICRSMRRQGYGSNAFKELLKLLGVATIEIEVLAWNKRGIGFWRSLGFKDRSICMRYDGITGAKQDRSRPGEIDKTTR